ncbi:MAG TPA: SPOR domain-containing protein [Gammaproteobacteria bacterium]|jgi:DedD protein|nr:SPOR domain-containing protein [Gammaproteobacteria bacterium]
MESKTKHRILGIVVVAGLAVLMYPFMLGNNHSTEKSLVKSPAFPDQATQVTSAEAVDIVGMPAEADQANSPAAANISDLAIKPESAIAADASPVAAEIPTAKNPTDVTDTNEKIDNSPHVTSRIVENNSSKIKKIQKKIAGKSVKKFVKNGKAEALEIHSRIRHQKALTAYSKSPVDKNGLMDLKSAAYVIQLGSFKQKTNALKLVNKLRSKGYRAFIQSVPTTSGENTRVFVGPEHKQTSARIVAAELKKEMKLQGIVISYQPFTL